VIVVKESPLPGDKVWFDPDTHKIHCELDTVDCLALWSQMKWALSFGDRGADIVSDGMPFEWVALDGRMISADPPTYWSPMILVLGDGWEFADETMWDEGRITDGFLRRWRPTARLELEWSTILPTDDLRVTVVDEATGEVLHERRGPHRSGWESPEIETDGPRRVRISWIGEEIAPGSSFAEIGRASRTKVLLHLQRDTNYPSPFPDPDPGFWRRFWKRRSAP
jgi:hypothetical protein